MTSDNQEYAAQLPHYALNPQLSGFSCIRCATPLPIGDYAEGCPGCFASGQPAAVRPEFQRLPTTVGATDGRDMTRYAAWMPYSSWVTLGEGGTPCNPLRALASEVGASAIFFKNEGMNPSGSHKDRVSCLTVTRALDIGATKIVAASSGNGGASLALYAAAAGLGCRIVATSALSLIHRRAITATGAELVFVEDSLERWRLVMKMVKEQGWFPATNYLNPPVGSNHFGVEGLKTVAYELLEDLGRDSIDAVLVPTSRGDLVWGLCEGFRELMEMGFLKTLPKLFAIEPFPRISAVLNGRVLTNSFPGKTTLFSIGGSTVTYQAVEAIRATGGSAVVIDDQTVIRDQARLARHGCYVELSSAATLTALEILLKRGAVKRDDAVVMMATSNGYKDLSNETGAV